MRQKGTKRRRRAEVEAWFKARQREGWSLRELAERSGMRLGTLSWWSHELRKSVAPASKRSRGFRRVVADESAAVGAAATMRIVLPDGTQLEVGGGVDADDLAKVLDALRSRC